MKKIVVVLAIFWSVAFGAGQGTKTEGMGETMLLGEMSLSQLRDQEEKFRREAERLGWEIDSILQIINRKTEIEKRREEKRDVLDPSSPQHQVEVMKPEVELLQRRLDALLEKERLIAEKLRLTQQAQEVRLRIVELQRQPKFRLGWLGFGYLADGKSGSDSTHVSSKFSVELGVRAPIGTYTAIGLLVGYTGKVYAGVEGFIPVEAPKQGEPYGSWITLGGVYDEYDKKAAALIGLRLGGERIQAQFRIYYPSSFPFQLNVIFVF